MLTQDDKMWIYKTLQNAILSDDFNITCEHCDLSTYGACKNSYCDQVMYKLRIETYNHVEKQNHLTLEQLQEERRMQYKENCEWVGHEVRLKKK